MTDPLRWGYVHSFADAVDGITQGTRFSAGTKAERDRSIAARVLFGPRRTRRRTAAPHESAVPVA